MAAKLWLSYEIHGAELCFDLLNLDHPRVEARILQEMASGVDVYYDRRWETTALLAQKLAQNPDWIANKSVLVLGAGIGLETLVAGHFCSKLFINDLAPVSLELCAEQLRRNSISDFVALSGRYDRIELPATDLTLGSFIIYNAETRRAMQQLLATRSGEILLVNENLAAFKKLLKNNTRPSQILFAEQAAIAVLFSETKHAQG